MIGSEVTDDVEAQVLFAGPGDMLILALGHGKSVDVLLLDARKLTVPPARLFVGDDLTNAAIVAATQASFIGDTTGSRIAWTAGQFEGE